VSIPGVARIRGVTEPLEIEDFLLLAAVVLLPWAFGGVELWAYRCAGFLLAAAAASSLLRHGWSGLGLGRRSRWLLPAFLLPLWAAVQLVPAPPGVIERLSPSADARYRSTFPGYPGPAPEDLVGFIEQRALEEVPETEALPVPEREALGPAAEFGGRWSGWRSLSLLPSAGVERLLWYLALLLGFLLARRRCASPEVAQQYRNALFITFVVLAVFGLIYEATSNGRLYWVRAVSDLRRPFGPYVNPNNFGAVMELATPWLAGFALVSYRFTRREKLSERRMPIFAGGALLCALAGLASASKATAMLLAGSLTLLALLAVRGLRRRVTVLGVAALVVAAGAVTLSQTRLGDRVREFAQRTTEGYGEVDRWVGWRASLDLIADFPITGSGFGSFRDVFPAYMPPGELAGWLQLHNDYLEVLADGGLIAGLLLVWLAGGFWFRILRTRYWHAELETAGLVLGVATLSLHALVDFNHQIPANALLWVTMAAICVARCEGARPPTGERP
jgi:O-antigen ligase